MDINLEPLIGMILNGIIAVVAVYAGNLAKRYVSDQSAAVLTGRVEQLLSRAADHGITMLRDKNVTTVRTENQLLGVAADYAARNMPTAVKHFLGVDPATVSGRQDLMDKIRLRLVDKKDHMLVDVDKDGIPDYRDPHIDMSSAFPADDTKRAPHTRIVG